MIFLNLFFNIMLKCSEVPDYMFIFRSDMLSMCQNLGTTGLSLPHTFPTLIQLQLLLLCACVMVSFRETVNKRRESAVITAGQKRQNLN